MVCAPLGLGCQQSLLGLSGRESVGVSPGVDRPVLGRAVWGDTILFNYHPHWEVELWPKALRLSLSLHLLPRQILDVERGLGVGNHIWSVVQAEFLPCPSPTPRLAFCCLHSSSPRKCDSPSLPGSPLKSAVALGLPLLQTKHGLSPSACGCSQSLAASTKDLVRARQHPGMASSLNSPVRDFLLPPFYR